MEGLDKHLTEEPNTRENETFEKRLESLINEYSKETDSNTPDYILARYMNHCLKAFNKATRARDKWYGGLDKTII